MRKKKLGLGKWVVGALVLGIFWGGYWLSLERPAPEKVVETPIELKLEKL